MNEFVEWITNPKNYAKLSNPQPTAGKKVGDIHQEIATFVNTKCGTNWTRENVRVKIQYIKKKYETATALLESTDEAGDTDENHLRDDIQHICPYYDALDKIYGCSSRRLARNPVLPPRPVDPRVLSPQPFVSDRVSSGDNEDKDGNGDFDNDSDTSLEVTDGKSMWICGLFTVLIVLCNLDFFFFVVFGFSFL